MKVKIGNYTSWFGPYQLAEKLMFWVPEEKDEHGFPRTADRVHKFGEWLAHGSIEPEPEVGDEIKLWRGGDRKVTWLYKFLLWIDGFKKRTIKVHIDRWDTWSMDHTLAYIVLPMLKQLKETKHGAPYVDPEDVPEELRPKPDLKDSNYDTDETHFERWDWVIDEMIFAFDSKVNDDWESQFESGESDHYLKKEEDGNYRMVNGPNHTKVYDWEGRKEYEARIANGFRLFGKYYQSLWD